MPMRLTIATPICFVAATLLGCGADGQEATKSLRSGLGECTAFSQSFFSQTSPGDKKLLSVASNFCWLTKSSGNFDGGNGVTGLYVQTEGDGFWHLVSAGPGGSGEARCAPLSCFSGDGVNEFQSDVVGRRSNRADGASGFWAYRRRRRVFGRESLV